MKDFAKIKNIQPTQAEGKVCIDLTDPLTGKVKERVEGNNHVFTDSLFSLNGTDDWIAVLQYIYLCMNNTNVSINAKTPYLFGQTVGYGIPNYAGSGLYRGSYNAANQVLAEMSLDSVRWKFQYDFTTAQANDIPINIVGLTSQYSAGSINAGKQHMSGFTVPGNTSYVGYTNDERYCYVCSNGIVRIYDVYLNTENNIDLTSIIGTGGTGITQSVGYALDTGHFYIYIYSSTANLRKMYEFYDSSFSTLLNTYPVSNIAIGSTIYPMYIYDDIAYFFTNSSIIYYADFIANTARETYTVTTIHNAMTSTYNDRSTLNLGTCAMGNKYIFCPSAASSKQRGIIFDLSQGKEVAYMYSPGSLNGYTTCRHPLLTEDIFCSSNKLTHNAAISAYRLAAPVTKTSANGLTVTYELEVFW